MGTGAGRPNEVGGDAGGHAGEPAGRATAQGVRAHAEFHPPDARGRGHDRVGSDSGAGNVPFGWGTHHELALLVEAGLTPLQALRAGTSNGAWVLEGDDATFGTIAPGKAADLVLLSRDPSAEIGNSRSIERVMQAGRWLGEE